MDPTETPPATPTPPRLRYDFLDGLRALAAWYVVFHHASVEVLFTPDRAGVDPSILGYWDWFFFERSSVDAFIVLSGFCLMLPLLRRPSWEVEGGFLGFMGRRALRILPGYYGAVVAGLLVTAFVPGLGQPHQARWDGTLPAFDFKVLMSHLLLVHNAKPDWSLKINYPLWSVATEWQIYFFFPAMAWLLRRMGGTLVLLAALGLGWAVTFHFHLMQSGASMWFMALFAMGMVAVVVSERPAEATEGPPGLRTLALVVVELMLNLWRKEVHGWGEGDTGVLLHDLVSGLMAAYLIVYCVRDLKLGPPGVVTAFLSSPPLVKLGHFAYSLYLVHAPVLAVFHEGLLHTDLTGTQKLLAMLFVGMPLAGGVSYLFSLVFERPFMVRRARKEAAAA
jgi:peptidoglycan/LPS O-acetylase OafA/YrhL